MVTLVEQLIDFKLKRGATQGYPLSVWFVIPVLKAVEFVKFNPNISCICYVRTFYVGNKTFFLEK